MSRIGPPSPATETRALPPVTGHVVRLMEGYPREIRVHQPLLVAVLFTAAVARLLGRLVTAVLQAGSGAGGGQRRFRDLRKGPEFLVTPLRVRTGDGRVRELEIHGHLPQSALEPADYIQATVRRQRDPELPPRVERIVNLTTGQLLTPRTPTIWSHLGPVLLLQAGLGTLLVLVVAACAVTH